MGRGGHVVEATRASDFSVEGIRVQNHLLSFQNLGNFVHPNLPVSFGRKATALVP